MSENRPDELNGYIEAISEKNDVLIVAALGKLEDPAKRGKFKLTVASVCQITGLSRNTVRNRPWALERLKGLKQKVRATSQKGSSDGKEEAGDGAILDGLRSRVRRLLEQNALLYEEVLTLQGVISEKNKAIEVLTARKAAPVMIFPRRVDISNPESNK